MRAIPNLKLAAPGTCHRGFVLMDQLPTRGLLFAVCNPRKDMEYMGGLNMKSLGITRCQSISSVPFGREVFKIYDLFATPS